MGPLQNPARRERERTYSKSSKKRDVFKIQQEERRTQNPARRETSAQTSNQKAKARERERGGGIKAAAVMEKLMEVLAKPIDQRIDNYVFTFFKEKLNYELVPNKLTGKLPLVASPSQLMLAIAAYLAMVITALGIAAVSSSSGTTQAAAQAKTKKKNSSVFLTSLVLIHNLFLVALSAFMCAAGIAISIKRGYLYRFVGNGMDETDTALAKLVYIFYVSKIYEFLDTVVMIAKGNMRQVRMHEMMMMMMIMIMMRRRRWKHVPSRKSVHSFMGAHCDLRVCDDDAHSH